MKRSLKRRRLEAKTDYRNRLELLKSEKNRVVIRKTNRYIIIELVESKGSNDNVIVGISSKKLLKYGWPEELRGSLKSRAAAYLTGFLFGVIVKDKSLSLNSQRQTEANVNVLNDRAKKKANECVLDIGMYRNIHKSRIYAALMGIIEAGLKVTHDQRVLPADDMIEKQEKTRSIFNKIKSEISHG